MGLFALLRQALEGGERDFTELPLRHATLLLAVPMVMEMAMESLFAVADIFWVSRLGADAVATVGLTEALIAAVYAMAFGLSMAATAIVSRRIGEREDESASLAAGQVLLLAVVLSLLVGIAGVLSGLYLLSMMGAGEGVLRIGTNYARIMLGGSLAGGRVHRGDRFVFAAGGAWGVVVPHRSLESRARVEPALTFGCVRYGLRCA